MTPIFALSRSVIASLTGPVSGGIVVDGVAVTVGHRAACAAPRGVVIGGGAASCGGTARAVSGGVVVGGAAGTFA